MSVPLPTRRESSHNIALPIIKLRLSSSAARWRLSALAVCAALILFVPRIAFAHLGLRSSDPANRSQLGTAPRLLRLTFTEAVERAIARVRLIGPSGAEVTISALRQPKDSGQVILADITGRLEAGVYRIDWQVIGRDGHPVRGTISFTVMPGAAGLSDLSADSVGGGDTVVPFLAAQDDSASTHHDPTSFPDDGGFGAESLGYVVIRWLQFAALLTVIGAVAFRFIVLGFLGRTEADLEAVFEMQQRAASVGVWASATLLLSAFVRLYAQSVAMQGLDQPLSSELILSLLTRTVWGWGWLIQAIASVAAVAGFQLARRRRASGWTVAAVAGLGLAVTPALSGHAAAMSEFAGLAIAADALHVIGAAGWMGSLLLVLTVGAPIAMQRGEGQRDRAIARLVNAFSPTALAFAGLVVVTGVFAAWLHVGFSSALWQSDYGRTLLIKLAIVAGVLGTGAYNWLKVKPALGDEMASSRIRRSATIELAIAVLVLLLSSVLVATPPPSEMDMVRATPAVAPAAPTVAPSR